MTEPAVLVPTAPPLPTEPRAYPHGLRTARARWWKGLLAIVCLVASFLLLSVILTFAGLAIDTASGRNSLDGMTSGQLAITPVLFGMNNLALAAMVPLSMLFQWAFFGVRPRWLSSVTGGLRWRWLGRAALIVVPAYAVWVVLSSLLVPQPGVDFGRLSRDAVIMIVIVVITTPLQAAGEEYGFRGLITRAVGSWFAGPVAALVSGLLLANVAFMIAHFATDPWLIGYYFGFGCVLGLLAWRTGGLEAPILIHVINNLFLLVPVSLYGDISRSFDRGPGAGGPIVLVPLAVLGLVAFALDRRAARLGVARVTSPALDSARMQA